MANFKDGIHYEGNVIYTPSIEEEPDVRGLGWAYFEEMSKNKDDLAQIDGSTGERDTFGTLLERCVRTAIALKEMGLQYGDVVSSCTYNHLNSCVPHISGFFIGAKVAALDPSLSLTETTYLFRKVMPKVIFCGVESVSLIENVIKEISTDTKIVVFGNTDVHVQFGDLVKPHPQESLFKPTEVRCIDDVALILFSSGTTGLPKGVCYSHSTMLGSATAITRTEKQRTLVYSNDSPFWNVFITYLHKSIFAKSPRLVAPNFDFNNPWAIFNFEITYIMLDITRVLALCYTPKPKNVSFSHLKSLIVSGTPISEDQMNKIVETFPGVIVSQAYGQTEVFLGITFFDLNNPKHLQFALTKKGSCGIPMPGINCKVVDPDTEKVLGPNQKGEIRVKTNRQLTGYYNMTSNDIWDADGWIKTGDYGYYDEDFCFYVVDRVKEMFEYRYKHITPATIESVINTHPAVSRSVVIGIPHFVDNYHAMAVVTLKPNSSSVTAEEIEKYVEQRVDEPYRLRAGVKFVKSLPLTPSGKVNRLKLKEMIKNKEIEAIM